MCCQVLSSMHIRVAAFIGCILFHFIYFVFVCSVVWHNAWSVRLLLFPWFFFFFPGHFPRRVCRDPGPNLAELLKRQRLCCIQRHLTLLYGCFVWGSGGNIRQWGYTWSHARDIASAAYSATLQRCYPRNGQRWYSSSTHARQPLHRRRRRAGCCVSAITKGIRLRAADAGDAAAFYYVPKHAFFFFG